MKKLLALVLALTMLLTAVPAMADVSTFTPTLFEAVFSEQTPSEIYSSGDLFQALAALLLLLDYTTETDDLLENYQWLASTYIGVQSSDGLTSYTVGVPNQDSTQALFIYGIPGTNLAAYSFIELTIDESLVDTVLSGTFSATCSDSTRVSASDMSEAAQFILDALAE